MSEISIICSADDLISGLKRRMKQPPFPGAAWTLVTSSSRSPELRMTIDGRDFRFTVVPKRYATRRDIERIPADKPTLLLTVQLTDTQIRHCADRGISAVGLNGRLWIRQPAVFVDTRLPPDSIRYRLAEPEIDPFSRKSSRVGRALLSSGSTQWTVTRLAEATELSISRVSEILGAFSRHGWVTGSRCDWELAEPEALLDAWAQADDWSKRGRLLQYTTLDPASDHVARNALQTGHVETAFTQWFAANLRHPHTQPPVCSAYRRRPLSEFEQQQSGFREVSSGGKLWIIVPRDEGVFQFQRRVDGFPLVCDVQIYLDLLQAGLRGPDQAQALRMWEEFRS